MKDAVVLITFVPITDGVYDADAYWAGPILRSLDPEEVHLKVFDVSAGLVDLTAAETISSDGIAVLIKLLKWHRSWSKDFIVLVSDKINRIFELMGLDRVFNTALAAQPVAA